MTSIVFAVVIILLMVAAFIDWRGLIEKWLGNNPSNGLVYVKAGNQIVAVKAKRDYVAAEGQLYLYRWLGKVCEVVVPENYGYSYFRGRRVIGVEDGKLLASPLGNASPDKLGESDVSSLILGRTVVDLVRTITGKKSSPWLWLLIGLGVGLIGFMLYQHFIGGGISLPGSAVPSAGNGVPAEGMPPVK